MGSVHFVGICGRLLAPLAIHLKELGVRVTGSDQDTFPPVADWLRKAGIRFHDQFDEAHVPKHVDLAIVGTYVRRGNAELEAILARGLPWDNAASWMGRHVLDSGRNLLVAGTNGKTTTASMAAHILRRSGVDAGWLIGGDCPSLPRSFAFGGHALRVIEADEYVSGLGDLNPKFLHYPAHAVAITNIAPDHLDTFSSADHYRASFRELIARLPAGRLLALSGDEGSGMEEIPVPEGIRTLRVGFARHCEARITGWRVRRGGSAFRFLGASFSLPMLGAMNARNAAMAATLAREAGIPPESSALALADFASPLGRMERFGRAEGIVSFRDDGYHPMALRESIQALRAAYPKRRLVVLFQPRYTGSRVGGFQRSWEEALAGADWVMAGCPYDLVYHPPETQFSPQAMLRGLRKRGTGASSFDSMEAAPAAFVAALRPGDVALISVAYRNERFWVELERSLADRFGESADLCPRPCKS